MSRQQHGEGADPSRSALHPFQFQPRATESLPQTLYGEFDETHGNRNFLLQDGYSTFSTTALGPSNPTIRLSYAERNRQQMPYHNRLTTSNIQTRDFYALPGYQSPLESAFGTLTQSERGLTTTLPAEAMNLSNTQHPMYLHRSDEDPALRSSISFQLASRMSPEFVGHVSQEEIVHRPLSAPVDFIAKPVPHRHDSGLSCDKHYNYSSVQDGYSSGLSTPGEADYPGVYYVDHLGFESGSPLSQHLSQNDQHSSSHGEGSSSRQDDSKNLQASKHASKICQSSMDGFVNYTLKDKKKLSEGVARSGSPKTRLRRKERAKEKKSRLVQSSLDGIAGLDPSFDLDAVHGLALDRHERYDAT